MAFVLTALGAALAVALELFEALAIVLAVALSRRPREAVAGAVAAALACGALGVVVGPVLVARAAGDPLRVVVGVAVLLFGMEWLRKGVLRLAGRRSRSSSFAEFLAEREALEAVAAPVPGRADWPGFVIAFKGVLHRPLRRLPETELKYVVGLVLTTFGTFFCAEGLGVRWPLGDASLLFVLAAWLGVSQVAVRALASGGSGSGSGAGAGGRRSTRERGAEAVA